MLAESNYDLEIEISAFLRDKGRPSQKVPEATHHD